jgi:hypothetical protein
MQPLKPGWATISPIATSGELAMKVWRYFHYLNFNPYEMSNNIFYTTMLPILNSSEIEVTDCVLRYYLDELALSSDIQPTFLQRARQKICQISH